MSESMFNEFIDDVFVNGEGLDLKDNFFKEDVKYVMDEIDEDIQEDVKYVMDKIDEDIKMDVKYVMDELDTDEFNDKINQFTKQYMNSNTSKEDKLSFLRLKNKYLIIKNINNYQELEKTLYKNKSKVDIVKFEISRIVNNIGNNDNISEQIATVDKMLQMYKENLSDDLYNRIINIIIKMELLLDMKIGLFTELCLMFENEMVV